MSYPDLLTGGEGMNGLIRGCGVALMCGGGLLILINSVLTPMMPYDYSEEVVRTTSIYLVRLSASGIDALLLLFGSLGVHLAQRKDSGAFGSAAFLAAFVGSCLLVAVEWSNVFVLRPFAQVAPETLDRVGESKLMMGGFSSSVGLFGLGWLMLALSVWRTKVLDRWAAMAVVAGLVLTTALAPLGVVWAIFGSVVFGVGLAGLGRSVRRAGV
jgi:hypothetical protein